MIFIGDVFRFLIEHPIVLIGVAAMPLLTLALGRQVFPTKQTLAVAAVATAFSFSVAFHPTWVYFVVFVDFLVVAILSVDLLAIPKRAFFQSTRNIEKIMSLGKHQIVQLELINKSKRKCQVEIVDDLPEDFTADPPKFNLVCLPKSRTECRYRIQSTRRGLFNLVGTFLKVRSGFGFWKAYYLLQNPCEVHVYPDLKQISEFGVMARTNRLSLLGVRRTRRIGHDNEFERLRDYTRDDNHRHIEWRATARKRKLMVKDFQANQNQTIMFLIDCGRMMTGESGRFTMLDHALNAMLLMSYVALKQGDSVGMMTFSDRIHAYTPPKNGSRQINRLLHTSFNQHAEYVESRFDEAFFYLNKNCRKRSLVVLITNLIDEINASQVNRYLINSTGRHLPLGVFLRDRDLFSPVDEFIRTGDGEVTREPLRRQMIFEAGAAADIIKWRHQSISQLTHGGVLVLDCYPEQLTATLLNRYLDIKARHLL